jgi:RNA polymerase sigma-70 factor (ECF subfamily)
MECPVGTVRSRIFRAREALDKVIKSMLGEQAARGGAAD